MRFENVSSPVKTRGSDIDVNLWLSPQVWHFVTRALHRLHVGRSMRAMAYAVNLGKLEIFLLHRPDIVTLELAESRRIMHLWTPQEKGRYTIDKQAISYLVGPARKEAKRNLALAYGLSTMPYDKKGL